MRKINYNQKYLKLNKNINIRCQMGLTFSKFKQLLLVSFLFFIATNFYAQGWLKGVDFNSKDFGEMTIQTPDGGYFMVGHTGDGASAIEDGFLIKMDVDGEGQWVKFFGGVEYDELNHIIPTSDGNYVLFGSTFITDNGGFNYYLIKINKFGEIIWEQNYGTAQFEKGIKVIQTSDGGFAMIGIQDNPIAGEENHDFYLLKTDENGTEEWSAIYGGILSDDGFDLVEMSNGSITFVGSTASFGAGETDFMAVNYSANGDYQWVQTYGGVGEEIAFSVALSPTGGLYLGGITDSFGAGDYDIYLVETDALGIPLATHTYGGVLGEWGTHLTLTNDAILLAGSTWSFGSSNHDIYLLKLNFDGSIIWSSILGEGGLDRVNGITLNQSGEILLTGTEQFFSPDFSNAFLLKADPNGQILTNHIIGKVFYDVDESCDFQEVEKPFSNWIVKAEGEETYYDITDENGNYDLRTDTGLYILTLFPPNEYWNACNNQISVFQNNLYDTTIVDFPSYAEENCIYLEVDISTASITPCQSSIYHVTYCNHGKTATTGEIELTIDDFLIFQSATEVPLTVNGQIYTFATSEIEPGDCGTFQMTAFLSCDASVGKTHSVKAEIFPDIICTPPPPSWDGSQISITAECVEDSTIIIIKNDGDDMDIPQPLIIVEDQIIARSNQFQLMADESTTLVVYPEGKTIYAEARQSDGHPGRSFPSVAIESCGASGGVESLGFVTQFPEDDADFFRSIDCQESADNFASQTRTYPKGVGTQAFIQPNRDIEYHILFQNTTTDTLFNLNIRDTLSSYLDWTTLRAGASSHPYVVDFSNEGILKFAFNDLQLPIDSFGFVKFRLSQKTDVPVESIVMNEPEMSLDFSTPNPTNAVQQTVQNEFMFDVFDVNLCWSETFGGISYTEDAVLFSPVNFAAAELLTATYINVHPTYEITKDTAVFVGDKVQNIPIFNDTTLVNSLLTWMNCDSVITTNVTIITGTNERNLLEKNVAIFPNPVSDFLVVEYDLQKIAQLEWTIFNNLGTEVLSGKTGFKNGKNTEKIDIENLPTGFYYLKLSVGKDWVGKRVLKE